jgi:hypothetical protein
MPGAGAPNPRLHPTALRAPHIGSRTCFVVGFVAEALSRTRAAAEPRAVSALSLPNQVRLRYRL